MGQVLAVAGGRELRMRFDGELISAQMTRQERNLEPTSFFD